MGFIVYIVVCDVCLTLLLFVVGMDFFVNFWVVRLSVKVWFDLLFVLGWFGLV